MKGGSMAVRRINWKFLIVLVIAVAILGVTAFGLRKWRRSSRASTGLEVGNKAYDEGSWKEAAKNLGHYLAVEQNDVEILLKYADAHLNIRPLKPNNLQQAIAAYRTVLRLDKGNLKAAIKLTELYLGMGMPGEAELIAGRQLEAASALQKDRKMESRASQDSELRRMLALALARQRKFDEAAAELRAIIEEHPEQMPAYETLGQLTALSQLTEQHSEGIPLTAEHWFNEAVKNNPSSAQAFIVRAAFHLRNKDNAKALNDLEQAQTLDLSDPLIRLRLATEFVKANMFDKARTHLVEVQAEDSTNQALWQAWAMLALKTRSKEEMLKVARMGLKELASQPWDFMPIATELFIRCGEFGPAAECLDKLKQKDIAPATVAFLEGLLAEAQKQDHKAILSWRKAMQLGNKSQNVQLALAAALSRAGNRQLAIRQLRTLVSEQPYLLRARLDLAGLLSQTGNWAETAEQARLAMQITSDNLGAALLYIQARIRLAESAPMISKAQIWQETEQQLTELDNLTNGLPEVKLLQFQLAMQRGQFADAERLLANLKGDENRRIEIAIAETDLLVTQGRIDQAISELSVLTEQSPQTVLPVRYLATLLAKYRSREDCAKVLKDAMGRIEYRVAKRDLGLLLARFYEQWAENDKAYQLLTALSQQLPSDVPVKRQLLECEQITKDLNQAQQIVNDIKAIEGEGSWQWRYEQASIWFRGENFKNQYPQIISLLKENLTADPDDQVSRMLLGSAYEKAGELQLAVSTYREAANRSPADIRILVPTVAALYEAKEYKQADELLNRAARQKLVHPELSKLELRSYLRRGELSSAEAILEDMMAKDPDNQTVPLSLALLKIRLNKYGRARELLGKLKEDQPESLPVIAALVDLNVRQKKGEEALALCDEMVRQLGDASAYILRGKTHVMLRQNDLAKEDFEQATSIEPDNTQAWVFKSDFNLSAGQLEEAIEDIQKALDLDPGNIQIQKRAVVLLLFSGEQDKIRKGRQLLDKALASSPQDIDLRLYKARSLIAQGTTPAINQATSILQNIADEQPKVRNVWALLAQVALTQGQSGRAIDVALQGLAHQPDNKTLLLLKAQAEATRLPAMAIPTLKVLRELDPNDVDVVFRLANMYIAANDAGKAVNLLRKQLDLCGPSNRRNCNIALATALYKNGNRDEAERKFDSLAQSAPDDSVPLLTLTRLLKEDQRWADLLAKVTYWHQKHADDTRTLLAVASDLASTQDDDKARQTAENILRIVLDSDPQSTRAMTSLGMILQIAGRFEESARIYQQILDLEPDNLVAINNLAWISCEELSDYQYSLELAQRGLQKAPEYVDLIDTRGMAYYRMGEYDKAVQDFTKCIELYPRRTPAVSASHLHLGRALVALGKNNQAGGNLRKALELNNEIGGLSEEDVKEAQDILKELSQGEGV